ncbi:major facilitator superfamily domain-containing protein [Xylaria sp. FL0064]|nr:major facilitator superfamily domain-containing protein [Xylaria sp. FL0064]
MNTLEEKKAEEQIGSAKEGETIKNGGAVDVEAVITRQSGDEALQRLERLRKLYGATWDGPDDPNDPYNWSSVKKITIGIIMGLGSLVTLTTASVTAAALGDISRDLSLNAETAQISFSVYFLGLAFGPFPIAAISEMNGRRNIWIACNIWFILWNSLCPVGYSKGLMIAGRFLAALGASVGNALAGPVMTDMFHEKDRGKSLAIAGLFSYLGPALGPILGGLVSQLIHWPWLFYIISRIDTVVLVVGILVLRETYTPVLLRRKAATLGLGQETTLNLGLAFGIYTLMLSTFAELWISRYGQSTLSSSLHYIAISVGIALATQRGQGRTPTGETLPPGKPEYRIPYMLPGILLLPSGLFWYGWSAQRHYHWVVVDIGAAVFTMGSFIYSQALTAYIFDEFKEYGASANAAVRVLSQTLGFVFPIFAPQLYDALDYGWGNSLLAFIFIVLAFPVPGCLWLWGTKLMAFGRQRTEK